MGNGKPSELLRWISKWLGTLSRINGVYQEVTLEGVAAEVKRTTSTPPDPNPNPDSGQAETEVSRS